MLKPICVLVVLLPVFVSVSCGAHRQSGHAAEPSPSDSATPPAAVSGLAGTVVRGPLSPISGIGGSSSAPVPGAKVIVSRPGRGGEIASTATDAAGQYQVLLPPGTYVVTLGAVDGYLFTKDLPATVTLTQGQTTTLNIHLDTGIR